MALALAIERRGAIINADASQIYADLPILSAMPTADEQAAVPHHLFGVLDGAESSTAARWAEMARAAITTAWDAGRLPILVGGTGLYQRILLDGIAPVPAVPAAIRAEVRALPLPLLRAALEREDAAMAARLHAHDPQRMARALEVIRATGQSLAAWQALPPEGGWRNRVRLEVTIVERPREELEQRIAQRIEQMWQAGALAEVARLAARNLSAALPVMRAIGVPPLLALLRGAMDEAAARERWFLDTRRYAKRQATWYRHQTL